MVKRIFFLILPLSYMLSIPLLHTIYEWLNGRQRSAHLLVTELDRYIPFVPAFVIPYVFWYVFVFLTLAYICYKNRAVYLKTLIAYNISLLISYSIYYFYQTTVPRPSLLPQDIFGQIIAYLYSTDMPYNCFPSIHVLSTYLIIKAVQKSCADQFVFQAFTWLTGLVIIASTVFIKQHVILDVIGGIFLAEVMFRVVHAIVPSQLLLPNKVYSSMPLKNKMNV
jgi:membrane-associated phospholipid phosphatase